MQINRSLFSKTNKHVLTLIKELNKNKDCTFLIPTKFISAECSQVGYLLNFLLNNNLKIRVRKKYKCFFSNSRFESLQGAIKIARHNFFLKKANLKHEIYIYSHNEELYYHFNLLRPNYNQELIPEINIINDFNQFLNLIYSREDPASYIIKVSAGIEEKKLEEAFTHTRKSGAIFIIDVSELDFENASSFIKSLSFLPDILIWGEALTDYQVPFGVLMMSDKIYKPWAKFDNCFIHSSTYGGNRLALKYVLKNLLSPMLFKEKYKEVREYCEKIKEDKKLLVNTFAQYINPGLVFLYSMAGFTLTTFTSSGSKLTVVEKNDKTRDVIDFISGAGAAIRGHNPADIIEEVVESHVINRDYVEELSTKMFELTKLPYLFPAVSGATAVEIGLILALTRSAKRKILTFKGNYSGKTLISLSVSEGDEIQKPFAPLYPEIVFLDPFSLNAEQQLIEQIESQELAIIWFEYIQGSTCQPIPENLIKIINNYKKSYDYLIGMDEILMGIYRSGSFLSFEGAIQLPDIITFSKALSDATFPIAATLISETLYQNVKKENPQLIYYFKNIYKNQLGAHIALHVIEKVSQSISFKNNIKNIEKILIEGFQKISFKSRIIHNIEGKGIIYKINYNLKGKLLNMFGKKIAEFAMVLYLTNLCFKKANVLLFFDRCIPSLTISEDEVKAALKRLEGVISQNETLFHIRIIVYQLKILFYYAIRAFKL